MEKGNEDFYDKTELFEAEIAPIIKELKLRCLVNNLPMFVTVAVKNDAADTYYRSDAVMSAAEVNMTENRIGKMMLRLNGYDMTSVPEWVRRDLSELNGYMASFADKETSRAGVELTKSLIPDMQSMGAYRNRPEEHAAARPDDSGTGREKREKEAGKADGKKEKGDNGKEATETEE